MSIENLNYLLNEVKKYSLTINCKDCSFLYKCNKKIKNTKKQQTCQDFKRIVSSAMILDMY